MSRLRRGFGALGRLWLLVFLGLAGCPAGPRPLAPGDYLDLRYRGLIATEADAGDFRQGRYLVDDGSAPFRLDRADLDAYRGTRPFYRQLARTAATLRPGRDNRWLRLLLEDAGAAAGREFADREDFLLWCRMRGYAPVRIFSEPRAPTPSP